MNRVLEYTIFCQWQFTMVNNYADQNSLTMLCTNCTCYLEERLPGVTPCFCRHPKHNAVFRHVTEDIQQIRQYQNHEDI